MKHKSNHYKLFILLQIYSLDLKKYFCVRRLYTNLDIACPSVVDINLAVIG